MTVLIGRNDPESFEFQASSACIRTMIWLAQADENAEKAGGRPFQYENEEVRALCRAWLAAWKRARTVPMFWNLFDRILSDHCKDLLGFVQIPRPHEETT